MVRPAKDQTQSTRRKPATAVTEKPVRRRPSRTRQPTKPLDPTPSRTVQQGEHRPFSQTGEKLPQGPNLQPQPIPHVTEQDSFVDTTHFTSHTEKPFTRFPSAFDHQPEEKFHQSPDFPTGVGNVPDFPTGVGNVPDFPRGVGNVPDFPRGVGNVPDFPRGVGNVPDFPTGVGNVPDFPRGVDNVPEGQFHHSPDVFDFPTGVGSVPEGSQHLGNDIHPDFGFGNAPRGVQGEELSTVEGVEENTNVIQPAEGDPLYVADEEVLPTTSLPIPDTTTETPFQRRRPSIRTRLRQRGPSRTTTPPPSPDTFQSEDPVQYDDEYSDDSLVAIQTTTTEDTPTTITTLSPFRQRIKDRLNRLNNRRRQSIASRTTTRQPTSKQTPSRSTTRQPTNDRTPSRTSTRQSINDQGSVRFSDTQPSSERGHSRTSTRQPNNDQDSVRFTSTQLNSDDKSNSDQITTTVSPRRRLLRPLGFDRSRFQSFRNKLRNRSRSRLTTTETPHEEEDTTNIPETPEEEVFSSGGRARRLNRFSHRPADTNEEGVLVVKEILRSSDQEVQETTHLEVSKKPEVDQTGDQLEERDSPAIEETFGEKPSVEKSTFNVQQEGEASQPRSQEADTRPIRPGFQGRRLADPNLRARFREFIKNRKNKLSSRYRTTEGPETSETLKQPEDATDEQTHSVTEDDPKQWTDGTHHSHHDAEGKSGLQDDASLSQQKEKEQPNDEALSAVLKERAERFEQRRKELQTQLLARRGEERFSRRIPTRPFKNRVPNKAVTKDVEQLTSDVGQDPSPFEEKQESEELPATRNDEQPSESLVQKVISIDGFRPIIETPPAPPTPLHPRPLQEPEIITAPPPSEENGDVMLFKVSAGFGGKQQQKEVTKLPLSDLLPPSTMIVREIGVGPPTTPSPQPPTPEIATPAASSKDVVQEDFAEQEGSESQHTPVLVSVQLVPDKATLHPDGDLALASATTTTIEPPSPSSSPSPSPTPQTEAPTASFPDSAQGSHASRPSFNLAAALARRSSLHKGKEADRDGTAGVSVTPVPYLTITMATGAPLLPLQMLLPLANSR